MWYTCFIIGILLYVTYRFLKYWILDPWSIHKDFWKQGIPGQYTPIVGELLRIRHAVHAGDPLAYSLKMAKKFGSYYHSSFGPLPRLVINDPLLIQGVLKTNARSYHKSNMMRLIVGSLLGYDNLLMAEDDIHSQHRRLIAPVFQHQNINSMVSLMVEMTSTLLDKWKLVLDNANNQEKELILDIHNEMARLTLDIVTGCVFGSGLMKNENVREVIYRNVTTTLQDLQKRIFNMIAIIPIINRLPLPSKQRIDKSKRDVKIVIQRIIDDRKKGLTKSACKGPDLLDLILAARSDDKMNKQLSDKEIYEEALTFVAAGHETTSNLMVWTLYNLTNNPDVCRRLEAEIDSVLHNNEEITASTLSLLTYTEAVLKESLRLHQPVPSIMRKVIEDNILIASDGKQILVKKDTDVMVNFFTLHHSEKYWNEPFIFDPSRFLNERHKDKFLPFSAGPRSCIGQNFAMLEAKVMLAMMIKQFRFELVPGQRIIPEIVITMKPKYGIWMKILPR